jgi:hypothetical protein
MISRLLPCVTFILVVELDGLHCFVRVCGSWRASCDRGPVLHYLDLRTGLAFRASPHFEITAPRDFCRGLGPLHCQIRIQVPRRRSLLPHGQCFAKTRPFDPRSDYPGPAPAASRQPRTAPRLSTLEFHPCVPSEPFSTIFLLEIILQTYSNHSSFPFFKTSSHFFSSNTPLLRQTKTYRTNPFERAVRKPSTNRLTIRGMGLQTPPS